MKKILLLIVFISSFGGCDGIEDSVVNPTDASFTITKLEAPDSLQYLGSDTKLSTSLSFPNTESIKAVWIKLFATDGSLFISYRTEMNKVSDKKYALQVNMTEEMPSTKYTIDYFVETSLQPEKKIASHSFLYNNMQNNVSPVISNLEFFYESESPTVLDTISRGRNFLLRITVTDENGLHDVDSVYTDLYNYQDTTNVVVTRIELFDDGKAESGDEIAGDGIYSRKGFFPTYSVGNRKFIFVAKDRKGERSNTIKHNFVVVQ